MDDAASIHHRLVMLGVRFRVEGDRLRFAPAELVTPELVEELRRHKAEIVRRLAESDRIQAEAAPGRTLETDQRAEPNPSLTGHWSRWGDWLACPFCRAADLIETAGGLRCQVCGRLAWRIEGSSLVRIDQEGELFPLADFPESVRRDGNNQGKKPEPPQREVARKLF